MKIIDQLSRNKDLCIPKQDKDKTVLCQWTEQNIQTNV